MGVSLRYTHGRAGCLQLPQPRVCRDDLLGCKLPPHGFDDGKRLLVRRAAPFPAADHAERARLKEREATKNQPRIALGERPRHTGKIGDDVCLSKRDVERILSQPYPGTGAERAVQCGVLREYGARNSADMRKKPRRLQRVPPARDKDLLHFGQGKERERVPLPQHAERVLRTRRGHKLRKGGAVRQDERSAAPVGERALHSLAEGREQQPVLSVLPARYRVCLWYGKVEPHEVSSL